MGEFDIVKLEGTLTMPFNADFDQENALASSELAETLVAELTSR